MHLLRRGSRIDGYHCRVVFAAEARSVFVVDHGRTGECRSVMVGIKGLIQFFPVDKVSAHRVPPVHVLPFPLVWIMLIEQMILSVIPYHPVGVIVPSPPLRIVQLRTALFMIHRVLSCYLAVLVNLLQTFSVIGYGQLFAFIGIHVAEYPIVGFARCKPDDEAAFLLSVDGERHFLSVRLVGDRQVQVALGYL